MTMESIIQSITNARITFALLSEFGISNASAQCIGYQEAVDTVTLGEVYKSSQLVIVSLRVCSGPQQTRSFYRVSDRAEISTARRIGNQMRRGTQTVTSVAGRGLSTQGVQWSR